MKKEVNKNLPNYLTIGRIILTVIIAFHEFGHFLLAKKNGIGVTEFSLGMGPRIASFVKGETRYSWKLIPFGGSCMMVGEDLDDKSENAFNSKSVWHEFPLLQLDLFLISCWLLYWQ